MARGRRRDQLPGGEVEQQHRGRVGPQRLQGPVKQLRQQLTIIEPGQRRVTLRQIISRVDYLSVDGRQLSLTAKVPVGGHRGNAIPRPLGRPPDPELTHAIICFLTNKLS
jgi:hypothetical protein